MASIWEAPAEFKRDLQNICEENHPHLAQANFWLLCSDGKAMRDNRVVVSQSKKCTKTEKLSTGCDFKIILMTEAWGNLTDPARRIALDEALCRCGVKFVPQTVEVNGKKEVVKDDLGRIIYTDEIDYDSEGVPKWKINQPDAGVYYAMLQRHGKYNEESENITRVLAGKPIRGPVAAASADIVVGSIGVEEAMAV